MSDFSEETWENLILYIQKKKCIPILGAGASQPWIPTGQQIAKRWAREFNYPFEDLTNLPKVAQFITMVRGGEYGDERDPKYMLARKIGELHLPDFSMSDYHNTVHSVLADLDLPIYITTNYDHLMEAALKSRGKQPISDFCRWNEISEELDYWRKHRYEPTQANPLVYHIHGDTDSPNSIVLTEEDYVSFLAFLCHRDGLYDLLPEHLYFALRDNQFLFIGYALQDITIRVILNLLHRESEARGVAVYLAPKEDYSNSDRPAKYASTYAKKYFKVAPTISFLSTLSL